MEYRPDQQKATIFLAILLGLSIILLVGVIWLLPLNLITIPILIGMAIFALLLLIFASNKLYQLKTMCYILSRDGLELTWGFRKTFIPNQNLAWARPVADFNSSLPLPVLHIPGLVLGYHQVQGLGKVEYGLTDPAKAVLVSGNTKTFAISPKQPAEFAAQVARFQQMGATQSLPSVDESLGQLWASIWAQKSHRSSILVGLGLSLLALVLAFAFSSIYPTVTWVTLEDVPSYQLFIMPALAFGIWLLNLLSGLFLFHQGQLEKNLVRWIWIASGVVAALLIIAMLLML
ncbi:MAG TPA: PH domain-containing protein [Anaerolineaceae bacterium]|nr:PH domain-containing protein [Anaerolineaceae bacterium]